MAKNLLQNSCDLVSVTPTAGTNQVATPQGLVKVRSQTATTVSSIQFTNLAQYPYTQYRLLGSQLITTVGASPLTLQISINNGGTYISTPYLSNIGGSQMSAAFLLSNNGNVTNGFLLSSVNVVETGASFDYTLYNINTPSGTVSCSGTGMNSNGATFWFVLGGGVYTPAANANAFQLMVPSGTFSGTFTLYGYS